VGDQYYETRLALVNLESAAQTVTMTLINDNGSTSTRSRELPGQGRFDLSMGDLFDLAGGSATQGWLRIQGQGRMAGYLTFSTPTALAAVVSLAEPRTQLTFSHVAVLARDETQNSPGYFTGLAIVNANAETAQVTIQVYNKDGNQVASTNTPISVASNRRVVGLLEQLVGSSVIGQNGGYVKVTSNIPVHGLEIFATGNLSAMANVPAQ
jgi:hypothetical protein